jgi:pimeloyl-ACP methyl ester carboxylesterase
VYPARVSSLILASTPRPALTLRRRHQVYLKAPWFFGLFFLAETPWRLRREVRAAIPNRRERRRFALNALTTFCSAPLSPTRMAARARLVAGSTLAADCGRITAPTLVVTGEAHLDYVVPVEGSSEYLRLIPNARAAVLRGTGHIGSMTRPATFAALVRAFVDGQHHAAA